MNTATQSLIDDIIENDENIKHDAQNIADLKEKRNQEIKDVKKKYRDLTSDVRKHRNRKVSEQSKMIAQYMRGNPRWYENPRFYGIVDNHIFENSTKKNNPVYKEFSEMFNHPLIKKYESPHVGRWKYPLPEISLKTTTTDEEIADLVRYIEPFFDGYFGYRFTTNRHEYYSDKITTQMCIYDKNDENRHLCKLVLGMDMPSNYYLKDSYGYPILRNERGIDSLSLFDACVKARDTYKKNIHNIGRI